MRLRMTWGLVPLLALLFLALPGGAAAQETAQTGTPAADTATTDTTVTDTATTDTAFTSETVETETIEPTDTGSTTTYYEEDDADDDGDEGGAAVCAACAAFGVAVPLVFLGISIAIAIWIYRDAKERNISSAALWAILGFLFSILGLVIYLIARKNLQPPAAPGSMAPPPPPA
ncbi:MAG TPA: PLDc N-terminal domain-containing protein [Thermoanaerobaculia bacterium]